jgi:hypothetical protein
MRSLTFSGFLNLRRGFLRRLRNVFRKWVSSLPGRSCSDASHQLGNRQFEGLGYCFYVTQRDVSLSALDTAHVSAIQVAPCGEFLLAQTSPTSKRSHSTPESQGDVARPPGHRRTRSRDVAFESTDYESHHEMRYPCDQPEAAELTKLRPAVNALV